MRIKSTPALNQTAASDEVRAHSGSRRRRRIRALAISAGLAVLGSLGATPTAVAAPANYVETASFAYPSGDATGFALDLDGDYAVFTQVVGTSVTIAHFTGPTPGDWEETTLTAPPGVTAFGSGAAIEGKRTVVTGTAGTVPSLYVYALTGTNTWTLAQTLTLPTPPASDTIGGFGPIVAIDGPLVAVGAPNSKIGGLANAGAVYLASLDTSTISRITAGTPVATSIFGEMVTLGGGYLAVASPQIQGTYGTSFGTAPFRLGRVHSFDLSSPANPTERVIDYPVNPKTYPASTMSVRPFGISLVLANGLLYVASPTEVNYTADNITDPLGGINGDSVTNGTTTQGAIYAFDPATGTQIGNKILPPPHSWGFAAKFDVEGNALAASAYQSGPASQRQGEVYIYTAKGMFSGAPDPAVQARTQPDPSQLLRPAVTPADSYFGSNFTGVGGAVALSGTRVAVGSPKMGPHGNAYIFEPIWPNVAPRTLTASAATVTYGQPSIFTAASDQAGLAGGTAEFAAAGHLSGPVPLNGHKAEWKIPPSVLDAGTYQVTASFTPPENGAAMVSAKAPHEVLKATTSVSVKTQASGGPAPGSTAPASTVLLTGTVAGQFGTIPTGQAEFLRGTAVLGSTQLDPQGGYSFPLAAGQDTGTITVRYGGDRNHLASQALLTLAMDVSPVSPEPPAAAEPSRPGGGQLPFTGGTGLAIAVLAGVLLGIGLVLKRLGRRNGAGPQHR
ncbi:MAG: hypothetical protein LBJ02_07740 [Bifidobacteriaceae bacterium]|jgi:hypothetical protein|nr:hypothetical protein [Bifidobacteriaceae bacterium]